MNTCDPVLINIIHLFLENGTNLKRKLMWNKINVFIEKMKLCIMVVFISTQKIWLRYYTAKDMDVVNKKHCVNTLVLFTTKIRKKDY